MESPQSFLPDPSKLRISNYVHQKLSTSLHALPSLVAKSIAKVSTTKQDKLSDFFVCSILESLNCDISNELYG